MKSSFLFLTIVTTSSLTTGQKLSWFAASDTHLGHDDGPNGTIYTSYEKNVWVINEMNNLPFNTTWPNNTWPESLGGGPVLPPVGVTISGDLIDSGISPGTSVNGCNQWKNFTALYGNIGSNGSNGLINYKVYEGRGNHDGANSTTKNPSDCDGHPTTWIIERNKQRLADPSYNVVNVSDPTGLHYAWIWNINADCRVLFIHQNLFPGYGCGSPDNPNGEGKPPGFPCTDADLAWAENSLGFLKDNLAIYAQNRSTMVVTLQHYGYDGFSNGWYNADQRTDLINTLLQYNTLAILVGHTHSAELYAFNGTTQGEWNSNKPGFINVINAPATQKEDGQKNPLPSEFMVIEAGFASAEDEAAGNGILRVAQRVGSSWGNVIGTAPFQCY